MTSQNEEDAVAAMQREKERERRRLRDRERRQNMSQEQRERHLARRRRNYQLRRLRAQNSKTLDYQPHSNTSSISGVDHKLITATPADFPEHTFLPISSKPAEGARNLRKFPRRIRVNDVRHLARRLHSDQQKDTGGATWITHEPTRKRLRLTHVKRLARAIKVTASQVDRDVRMQRRS